MSELAAPWSREGFDADVKNDRVFNRRMKIMELIIDSYRPSLIAEVMEIPRQRVSDDVRWLRKNGYLSPDYNLRRKFRPTIETTYQICEWLRKNWTYKAMGAELGVSAHTVCNYVLNADNERIKAALKYKRNLRTNKPTPPPVGSIGTKEFVEFFKCDPEIWSDANVMMMWGKTHWRSQPHSVRKKINRMRKAGFEIPEVYTEYWEKKARG